MTASEMSEPPDLVQQARENTRVNAEILLNQLELTHRHQKPGTCPSYWHILQRVDNTLTILQQRCIDALETPQYEEALRRYGTAVQKFSENSLVKRHNVDLTPAYHQLEVLKKFLSQPQDSLETIAEQPKLQTA